MTARWRQKKLTPETAVSSTAIQRQASVTRGIHTAAHADAARPGNDDPNAGQELRAAIDAVLNGQALSGDQKPAVGCSIKWKGAA